MNTTTQATDQNIVLAIKEGSYSAFERIFKTYYSPLCGFATSYLKDRDSSEETVQQVFFNFWEKRETIYISSSIKAYLYQAVRNHCINLLKHEQVKTNTRTILLRDEEPGEENEIESLELQQRIELAIAELPTERQRIFKMSRFDEKKYKEIADELNISVKTVENQMGKALKYLRDALADVMPFILWFLSIFFKTE